MTIDPRRLLGLAFASADLLVEIGADERVSLMLGAGQSVLGAGVGDPVGKDWRALIHDDDQALVEAMIICVADGVRRAYAPVRLSGADRAVSLSARGMPQNEGRVSCALTACPMPPVPATVDGLHCRQDFEQLARDLTEAARATGVQLELAMIDLAGLDAADPELARRAAGALRLESEGGTAAARLSQDRFALLRRQGEDAQSLVRRLTRAIVRDGDKGEIGVAAHTVTLDGASPTRLGRALSLALDDFMAEGLKDTAPGSLAEAMNRSVRRTLARAGELGAAVSQRRFTLAFQPVVSLADGALHHHEVLVRFENAHSPFALVRMAEEFDLIEELDQAVVEQTVRRLKADRGGAERLAVNVSGMTITSPRFVTEVETLIRKDDRLRGRLLFEITESAAIDDLSLADRHIQRLRALGSMVCLDDFGAGAASLAYLQRLSVDIVKIDGRYVRELVAGGRDAAVVSHVVNLCRDLDVRTVAEMVETPEVEAAVRAAGVDFGQGWFYGRPADRPEAAAPRAAPALSMISPVAARRTGTRDGWQ
ncbi:MAG: EAL domain-containing protein [Caulobacter sp.]|nr:EAL domain-containing protein [Caulobacter sp.]